MMALLLVLVDFYVYKGVKHAIRKRPKRIRKIIKYLYWTFTAVVLTGLFIYNFGNPDAYVRMSRTFIMLGIFSNFVTKLIVLLFLLVDDLVRIGKWIAGLFRNPTTATPGPGEKISRSDFLVKAGLITATVPLITMSYGIVSGAHDYRIRRQRLALPNLPKAFDGLRLVQLSDIHTGSFFNKTAVKGGIEMVMAEKPDLIVFTGDLVNVETREVNDYIDLFGKIEAPLGVYSITGNHDYGDYRSWPSAEARQQNFDDLIEAHRLMGWNLLLNENHLITQGGDTLALIGVENWGAGRFSKYGDLAKAYAGAQEAEVKILLSHDPSHWDAQVRPEFPDIDLMLAGHTHGFQFGVESDYFKWSPSQYVYEQWAGLYTKGNQHLYVNRGFGYIGYPGRIGIPPEITVLELVRG
jgi:uncharacterized protein